MTDLSITLLKAKMICNELPAINHDEIARLAYLNWEKDGRPGGQDQKYWLEAEQQLKATGHLLISELSPPANQSPIRVKSNPRRPQQPKSFSQT